MSTPQLSASTLSFLAQINNGDNSSDDEQFSPSSSRTNELDLRQQFRLKKGISRVSEGENESDDEEEYDDDDDDDDGGGGGDGYQEEEEEEEDDDTENDDEEEEQEEEDDEEEEEEEEESDIKKYSSQNLEKVGFNHNINTTQFSQDQRNNIKKIEAPLEVFRQTENFSNEKQRQNINNSDILMPQKIETIQQMQLVSNPNNIHGKDNTKIESNNLKGPSTVDQSNFSSSQKVRESVEQNQKVDQKNYESQQQSQEQYRLYQQQIQEQRLLKQQQEQQLLRRQQEQQLQQQKIEEHQLQQQKIQEQHVIRQQKEQELLNQQEKFLKQKQQEQQKLLLKQQQEQLFKQQQQLQEQEQLFKQQQQLQEQEQLFRQQQEQLLKQQEELKARKELNDQQSEQQQLKQSLSVQYDDNLSQQTSNISSFQPQLQRSFRKTSVSPHSIQTKGKHQQTNPHPAKTKEEQEQERRLLLQRRREELLNQQRQRQQEMILEQQRLLMKSPQNNGMNDNYDKQQSTVSVSEEINQEEKVEEASIKSSQLIDNQVQYDENQNEVHSVSTFHTTGTRSSRRAHSQMAFDRLYMHGEKKRKQWVEQIEKKRIEKQAQKDAEEASYASSRRGRGSSVASYGSNEFEEGSITSMSSIQRANALYLEAQIRQLRKIQKKEQKEQDLPSFRPNLQTANSEISKRINRSRSVVSTDSQENSTFDNLYRDSELRRKKLDSKAKQLQNHQSTFSPTIKGSSFYNDDRSIPTHELLYHHSAVLQRKKEEYAEKLAKENTFQPVLVTREASNPYSRLQHFQDLKSVVDRLYNPKEQELKRENAKLKQQYKEQQECTFTPQINLKNDDMSTQDDSSEVFERNYQVHSLLKENLKQKKQLYELASKKDETFKPTLISQNIEELDHIYNLKQKKQGDGESVEDRPLKIEIRSSQNTLPDLPVNYHELQQKQKARIEALYAKGVKRQESRRKEDRNKTTQEHEEALNSSELTYKPMLISRIKTKNDSQFTVSERRQTNFSDEVSVLTGTGGTHAYKEKMGSSTTDQSLEKSSTQSQPSRLEKLYHEGMERKNQKNFTDETTSKSSNMQSTTPKPSFNDKDKPTNLNLANNN